MLVDYESEVTVDGESISFISFGHHFYRLALLTLNDTQYHNLTISMANGTSLTELVHGECDSRFVRLAYYFWSIADDRITFYLQITSNNHIPCQFSVFPAVLQLHSIHQSLFCSLSLNPIILYGVEYNYQCSLKIPPDEYSFSLQLHGRWLLEPVTLLLGTPAPTPQSKFDGL